MLSIYDANFMIITVTISIGPLVKCYPKSNFMFVCGEQEHFFFFTQFFFGDDMSFEF